MYIQANMAARHRARTPAALARQRAWRRTNTNTYLQAKVDRKKGKSHVINETMIRSLMRSHSTILQRSQQLKLMCTTEKEAG